MLPQNSWLQLFRKRILIHKKLWLLLRHFFKGKGRQIEAFNIFYTAAIKSDGITDEPELATMNQVIGEGVIFTLRYLLRMITDGKVDPEDVVTVKAYDGLLKYDQILFTES